MDKIELGRTGGGGPMSPMSMSDETHYPSLYIEGRPGQDITLPESGSMMVSFKVREESERKTKDGAVCTYSLDILSIDSCKGAESKKTSPAEGFDKSAKEVLDTAEEEAAEGE